MINRDTPKAALRSSPPVTAVDGGMVEAMKAARDQILDSYRTWVADDMDAFPRKGQIPRYDQIVSAIAKVEAALASQPAVEGEAVAPIGYMREKDNDGTAFWVSKAKNAYYSKPIYASPRPAAVDAGVREALRETRKIYLASRYSRFPEMQKVRADLEAMGYTVTSRWINGGHELTKEGSTEAHEAERVRYAQEDFEDLLAADTVISFTEVPRETKTRGGRHVEHGMALALGKRTIVIGWRENVFHCLPQCEFFADWAAAALSLAAKRGQE